MLDLEVRDLTVRYGDTVVAGTVLLDGEPVFENPSATRRICFVRGLADTVDHEFALLFAVWAAAGALAGAALYRGPGPGVQLAPVALVLVGVTEAVAGAVALACIATTLPVTWLLVRDLPLRNRPT